MTTQVPITGTATIPDPIPGPPGPPGPTGPPGPAAVVTPPFGASSLGYWNCQFNFTPQISDITFTNDPAFKFAAGLYYQTRPAWANPALATTVNGMLSLNNIGPQPAGTSSNGNLATQMQTSTAGALGYLVAANGFYCQWRMALSGNDPDHWEALWMLPQEKVNGALNYVEIDLQEGGFAPGMFSTVIQWIGPWPNYTHTNHSNSTAPPLDKTLFHDYGVSYSPIRRQIVFYCDGVAVFTVDTSQKDAAGNVIDDAIRTYNYYMIAGAQSHKTNVPYSMYLANMQAWIP